MATCQALTAIGDIVYGSVFARIRDSYTPGQFAPYPGAEPGTTPPGDQQDPDETTPAGDERKGKPPYPRQVAIICHFTWLEQLFSAQEP